MKYFLILLVYVVWGTLPIAFFKIVDNDPVEVLFWRVTFILMFLLLYIGISGKTMSILAKMNKKTLSFAIIPGILLGLNWLAFAVAINFGEVIQSSLGFLICPIFSLTLAHFFLKERLNFFQKIILLLLLLTLIFYTISTHAIPSIAIVVFVTWGIYGFIQRKYPQEPIFKTTVELMFIFCILLIIMPLLRAFGHPISIHHTWVEWLSYMGTAFFTTGALVSFNALVKDIPFQVTSILQYMVPIGQAVSGYFFYKESMSFNSLLSYSVIFVLALVFTLSKVLRKETSN